MERSLRLPVLFSLGLLFLSLAATADAHGPWQTFKDCYYLPNPANDGDSFHVRTGGKEYLFRLYFVDAAETDYGLRDRVDEQAKYFGLSVPQTLKLGELAKVFTKELLARPFTVRTCMQDALGRSKLERFYAFVETDGRDLGEELVANGLARVHGTGSKPPGISSPEREWEKLERLEREAKQQKVGAWGVATGRMNARLIKRQPQDASASFDAFFHPTAGLSSPAIGNGPAVTKLNINSATAEQLQNIPGVGPVLSERIIAARPFESADDLRKVKGIGEKTYAKLRPYFD